jgi:predicted SprT family Zn-dependent metalloprotease
LFDTIPHEVAHLIVFELCRQRRSNDRGHGSDFKRVCRALGGSGKRCHDLQLERARKTVKYIYQLNSGREVRVGKAIHNKILGGDRRFMKDTKESLLACHFTGKSYIVS